MDVLIFYERLAIRISGSEKKSNDVVDWALKLEDIAQGLGTAFTHDNIHLIT